MKTSAFLIAAATLAAASSSLAATLTWSAGTGGDASGAWNTSFNGQTFTSADDFVIDSVGATPPSKTITVDPLALGGGVSLTVSATGVTGTTSGVGGTGTVTLTGSAIGGTLSKTGSADLVLASANNFGTVTLSNGKFFVNNAAGLGTTGTLNVNSGAASGVSGSYSAATSGKFFYDSYNINADATFSKGISFGAVGAATTYGMVARSNSTTPNTTTLTGNISGGSNVTLWLDASSASDGYTMWKLAGADNSGFTGTLRLNRGRLFLENAKASGSGALFIQSNGSSGAAGTVVFNFDGTINNTVITLNSGGSGINYLSTNGHNVTVTGNVVSSSAGLGKSGTGTLTLTNTANDVTAATTVADGTLSIGGAGRLNSGAYAGAVGLTAATSTFDYASSATQTLSGVVSGLGKVTKSGSGSLTLTGTNTFAAGTTVSAGTLITGNVSALGAGAVAVTAGTLRIGNGTVNTVVLGSAANLAVSNGAILQLGALNTASLDGVTGVIALSGGGTYTFNASGKLDLGGFLNGAVTGLTAGTHTYTLISGGTGTDVTLGNISGYDSSITLNSFTNGVLTFTAVPEPSTYGLLGAGALAAAAIVRRRRKALPAL